MMEFEYRQGDDRYQCRIEPEASGIVLTGYRGNRARLKLPEMVEWEGTSYVLRAIGKKAFFGNRTLRSVQLPAGITQIGDWAFSQCGQLEGISMETVDKSGYPVLGNGVFADSRRVGYIAFGVEETDDLAILLAATVHLLPSEDLLKDPEAGSAHWYRKWDQRLLIFLNGEDADGYTDMVLCGEEDIRQNMPEYIAHKQRRKAALCMLRLLHDRSLSEDFREEMVAYLLRHTKGCASEAAWEVIVEEYGQELVYYRLFADIGGITSENIDAMLADLDASHAEAKAFLLRYQQEHFAAEDVFDLFTL